MSWQQMDKGGNWSFPILDRPAVSVWTGNGLCNDDFLHNIAEINEKACVLFKSFRCFSIPLFFNYNVCFYQDRSGSYFFCGPVGFFQSNSVVEAFHIIIVVVFILFLCRYWQVYSTVRGTIRLDLIQSLGNGRQVSFREELINLGFGERAEENYLSKARQVSTHAIQRKCQEKS